MSAFSPYWHPLRTADWRGCYNCSLPRMYPKATVKQGHLIVLLNSLHHVFALLCLIASIKFQWVVVLFCFVFLFFLMCSMSVSNGNLENLKFKNALFASAILLCKWTVGLTGDRETCDIFFPVTQSGTSPPLRVSHTLPKQLEWARLPIVALVETLYKPK